MCLTDRLDVEDLLLGDGRRVRETHVPRLRVRKISVDKRAREFREQECRTAGGTAEPTDVTV